MDMADTTSKREKILEMRSGDDPPTQEEVAEELDISQSYVSDVETSHRKGKETGKQEGYKDGYMEARSWDSGDETPQEDDDDYWCAYCEDENDSKVEIEYLADECPNGHDLSGDWSSFE